MLAEISLASVSIAPTSGSASSRLTQTDVVEATEIGVATRRLKNRDTQASATDLPVTSAEKHDPKEHLSLSDPQLVRGLEYAYEVLQTSVYDRSHFTSTLLNLLAETPDEYGISFVDLHTVLSVDQQTQVFSCLSISRLFAFHGTTVSLIQSFWPRCTTAEPVRYVAQKVCDMPYFSAQRVTYTAVHPAHVNMFCIGSDRGVISAYKFNYDTRKLTEVCSINAQAPLSHTGSIIFAIWQNLTPDTPLCIISASTDGSILVWELRQDEGTPSHFDCLSGAFITLKSKLSASFPGSLPLGKSLTSASVCHFSHQHNTVVALVSTEDGHILEVSFTLRRPARPASLVDIADASKSGLRILRHYATVPAARRVAYLDPSLIAACRNNFYALRMRNSHLVLDGLGTLTLVDATPASGAAGASTTLLRFRSDVPILDFLAVDKYVVALTESNSIQLFSLLSCSGPLTTQSIPAGDTAGPTASSDTSGDAAQYLMPEYSVSRTSLDLSRYGAYKACSLELCEHVQDKHIHTLVRCRGGAAVVRIPLPVCILTAGCWVDAFCATILRQSPQ